MKTKLYLAAALVGAVTLSTQAGVSVGVSVAVPAPVVVVPAPVIVPDAYVYDGVENVGVINGAYFYLGPGNVWIACGPDQLTRFHGWERGHPDWRDHSIRNERYRNDGHARGEAIKHDDRDRDRDHRH